MPGRKHANPKSAPSASPGGSRPPTPPAEKEPQPSAPGAKPEAPAPEDDSPGGLPTYVTTIASLEEQVGGNVVRALQHEGAMGALTVVQSTPAGQRIVSVPLSEELLSRVSDAIGSAEESEEVDSVPCIGFHCALPHRSPPNQEKESRRDSKP